SSRPDLGRNRGSSEPRHQGFEVTVARLVRHRTACADQPRVAHFGDRVPLAGERVRWSGASDPATARRRRRRPLLAPAGCSRSLAHSRVAGCGASGHGARRWGRLSGQTLWFTVRGRAADHWNTLVRTVVLWAPEARLGGWRWSSLVARQDAARSTRESLRRKDWSRTLIRCMRSATRADRSSGARRARAGGWSRPLMMMAGSRAAPWSARD